METDILLFNTAGTDRGTNDANNKRRENVLRILHNPPSEYIASNPLWATLSEKWNAFLATLCPVPYTSIDVKKKAGRSANYDFSIKFLNDGKTVHEVKGEFKHNAKTIDALPEYLSVATNKPYMSVSYAEYFYDTYIDAICALDASLVKPERSTYLRYVYNSNYDAHPFFATLYANEKTYYNEKRAIVQESIRTYLEKTAHSLDVQTLTNDIRTRQSGKVYILWDLENFIADTIRDDEMEIVSVEEVKNGNVLVAMSRAGTRHKMLLRWKNHLGVLYPAWQISLAR
jgi:hypothetical protein